MLDTLHVGAGHVAKLSVSKLARAFKHSNKMSVATSGQTQGAILLKQAQAPQVARTGHASCSNLCAEVLARAYASTQAAYGITQATCTYATHFRGLTPPLVCLAAGPCDNPSPQSQCKVVLNPAQLVSLYPVAPTLKASSVANTHKALASAAASVASAWKHRAF